MQVTVFVSYLYAYRKPSTLVLQSIKVRGTYTSRGGFLPNCVTIIVLQSLIFVFTHSGLRKTVLLVKNTLHDDPLPDDGTKMINLRVNKEESKNRVEKKPYQD